MSQTERVDWSAVASIRASRARRVVVEALQEGPKYATEIAERSDYSRQTVSNQFRWLKSHEPKLVENLTPERNHHIIHGLTEAGEVAAREA